MMGLDAPPKWKQKKFTKDDFESQIGEIVGSARYVDARFHGTPTLLAHATVGTTICTSWAT